MNPRRRLQMGPYGDILRPATRVDHLLRPGVENGAIVLALTAPECFALTMLAGSAQPPDYKTAEDDATRERLRESFERDRKVAYEVGSLSLMTPWQAHPDHMRATLAALVAAVYEVIDGHGDLDDLRDRAEEAEALAAWWDDPQAVNGAELYVPPRRPVGPDEVVTSLLDQGARNEAKNDQEDGDADRDA